MTNQLEEYIKALMHHDWFYDYSDDHGVWRKGKENQDKLFALSHSGEAFKMAYDSISKYMLTNASQRDFNVLDSQLNQARALEKM